MDGPDRRRLTTAQGRRVHDRSGEVSRLIDLLYAGALDEAPWRAALKGVYELVGGHGIFVLASDPRRRELLRYDAIGIDTDLLRLYDDYWFARDVRLSPAANKPVGLPMTEQTLVGARAWKRSEIYNEFLRAGDLPHIMAAWLNKSPNRLIGVSLQRSRSMGPFGEHEAAIYRQLIPHLTRALQIKDRLRATQGHERALIETIDRLPVAVLLLDRRGKILEMSSKARSLLATEESLRCDRGRLCCADSIPDRELGAIIGLTAMPRASSLDRGGVVRVPRGPGRSSLTLLVIPVEAPATWLLTPSAAVLVMAFDRDKTSVSVPLLQRTYSLTPAEARLVALLACGMTFDSAAGTLHVRSNTLKSQLKAAFAKVGCHSRSELIRTVLTGPAMVADA